jgi:hypothetical protein
MPLKLRPSGLRFGIDKDRPTYTSTQALERRPLGRTWFRAPGRPCLGVKPDVVEISRLQDVASTPLPKRRADRRIAAITIHQSRDDHCTRKPRPLTSPPAGAFLVSGLLLMFVVKGTPHARPQALRRSERRNATSRPTCRKGRAQASNTRKQTKKWNGPGGNNRASP